MYTIVVLGIIFIYGLLCYGCGYYVGQAKAPREYDTQWRWENIGRDTQKTVTTKDRNNGPLQ